MKKITCLLLLVIQSANGMYISRSLPLRTIQSSAIKNPSKNFGTTQFIMGYKEPYPVSSSAPVTKPVFIPREKIARDQIVTKNGQGTKKAIDSTHLLDDNALVQSFFTSRHDIRSIIKKLLERAKKTILIAAFTLTDHGIEKQLTEAYKNGITVEIITDAANTKERYSRIKNLVALGIPASYYSPALNPNFQQSNSRWEGIMHHKFIIIDGTVLITGSANLTKAGQEKNVENINVIRDKKIVDEYMKEFDHLRPQCIACKNNA